MLSSCSAITSTPGMLPNPSTLPEIQSKMASSNQDQAGKSTEKPVVNFGKSKMSQEWKETIEGCVMEAKRLLPELEDLNARAK